MNTADITCDKMTERTRINNNQHLELNTELEVLAEVYKFKRNKCSNTWYDRVYICYEDVLHNQPNESLPIKGFNCYKYNSFENAYAGWDKDRPEFNKMSIRVTMVPMCKWIPQVFDKYILNWKLRDMYWLGKHTIGQGYNRNSKEK